MYTSDILRTPRRRQCEPHERPVVCCSPLSSAPRPRWPNGRITLFEPPHWPPLSRLAPRRRKPRGVPSSSPESAIGLAGGTAIILGTTVARTSSSTSGNTPESGFASCESLKSNPVYRGNECDALKGPNKALVVGGAIAAATGVTLALIGSANSSVTVGPGVVGFRHRLTF